MNTPGQNQQTAKKPVTRRVSGAASFVFSPGLGSAARTLGDAIQMFRNLVALLFLSSGMLDKTHPFFRPGIRFTLSDIYYETRARVDWKDKTKMPQNIFFCAVWGLFAICALWVVVAIMSFMMGTAHAAGEETAPAQDCIFCAPEGDLATSFIRNLIEGEQIAGVGSYGEEGYRPAGPPTGAIQGALRAMLSFYSSAILAFASFILLYHVINMIVNAAWSGKALEGAAQIWAPLRLVIAICLLVPLSNNLNAAQLMTLKIAEIGSGIATKAWQRFAEEMGGESGAAQAVASMASVNAAAENLFQIYACMYEVNFSLNNTAAALPDDVDTGFGNLFNGQIVRTYRLNPLVFDSVKYMIGDPAQKEMCGSYVVPRPYREGDWVVGSSLGGRLAGLKRPVRQKISDASETLRQNIQNIACKYVAAVRSATKDNASEVSPALCDTAGNQEGAQQGSPAASSHGTPLTADGCQGNTAIAVPANAEESAMIEALDTSATQPAKNAIACAIDNYYKTVTEGINALFTAPEGGESAVSQVINMDDTSWVEAGAYFVLISAIQNAISSAASEGPTASAGKLVQSDQFFRSINRPASLSAECGDIDGDSMWDILPVTEHQKDFVCHSGHYKEVAQQGATQQQGQPAAAGGTVFAGGLFEARKDAIIQFFSGPALRDPIGALFSFGHMLYIAATVLIMSALAAAAAAGAAGFLSMVPGIGAATAAAEFWVKVAIPLGFITLGMAFPLAFLLPILPLVRFLSAVMSWLLAIFEAVVSMPLFALAHLNPGGNTLFAPAATGYQFLFHIAIKPILLVFGMIGAILVLPIVLYALNIMFLPALDATWGEGDVMIWTKVFFFIAYATSAYGFVNISLRAIDDLSQKSVRWANFQGYQFRDDSEAAGSNAAAFAQYATTGLKGITSAAGGLVNAGKQAEQKRLGNMKTFEQARGLKALGEDGKETSLLKTDSDGKVIMDKKKGPELSEAGMKAFGDTAAGKRAAADYQKRVQRGARVLGAPGTGGRISSDAMNAGRADIMLSRANAEADDVKKTRKEDAANAAQATRDANAERGTQASVAAAMALGGDDSAARTIAEDARRKADGASETAKEAKDKTDRMGGMGGSDGKPKAGPDGEK